MAEIEHRRMRVGLRHGLLHLHDGLRDGVGLATVDDDFRAHSRQPDGGGEPDAAGRAGDERELSGEVDVHLIAPCILRLCWVYGLPVNPLYFAGAGRLPILDLPITILFSLSADTRG